jgi:hypothetical protein
MATWDAAQRMGGRHGNVRDPEMPTRQRGRRYKLRSRLSLLDLLPPHDRQHHPHLYLLSVSYYRCRTIPACPAATPPTPITAPSPSAKEIMATALAWFFTQRVLGPDRAAMLTTQLPASAAGQAQRCDRQAAAIRRKIARPITTGDHITRSCWPFDQAPSTGWATCPPPT